MEKRVRVAVGLMGSGTFLVFSLILNYLGQIDISMALSLAIGGALGFFGGWWGISSRFRVKAK